MLEMIYARKSAEKKEERYDLFSSLLDASEDEEDGQAKLTDRELLGMLVIGAFLDLRHSSHDAGNIFIFLLAGSLRRGITFSDRDH